VQSLFAENGYPLANGTLARSRGAAMMRFDPKPFKMFQNESRFCERSICHSSENSAPDCQRVEQNFRVLAGHGEFAAIDQNASAYPTTTYEHDLATPRSKMQETLERQRNFGDPDCHAIVQNASLLGSRRRILGIASATTRA
jgi:hypothetical protein